MKPDSVQTLDLIAVLGMHRSGTSAITRGLQALGVELGANLMPPAASMNAKGFFEDLDIVDINISLLNHLRLDWHDAASVTASQVEDLCASGYLLKAAALIRQKIATEAPYGIKDPRLSKLMPFWEKVFQHCELNVGYVIAIRNPISVANSLKIRDGFSFEKSYLLWLDHTLAALIHTEGCRRVVLDFDLVLENPTKQLGRIADALGLDSNAAAVSEYTSEFLEEKLRHNVHQPQDLAVDPRISPMICELYAVLRAAATTECSLSISRNQLADFEKGRNNLRSSMVYIDRLNQAVAYRDGQLATLNETVAERDGQLATLNQTVADRDGQLASLNEAVAERDGQLATLNQAVADRDGQLASLNEAVAQRDSQLTSLNEQIMNLNQLAATVKKWQQLSRLKKVVKPLNLDPQQPQEIHPLRKLERSIRKKRIEGYEWVRFNKTWYLKKYPDVGQAGVDPWLHYLEFGKKEGRAPNAKRFDKIAKRGSYQEWIKRYEETGPAAAQKIRDRIETLSQRPLISVVLPVYNPNPKWLIEAIESVRNQIYPDWELCIADDASTNLKIRSILKSYTQKDPRIKVVFREKNGHISACSNSALEIASGQWIALLDHDDLMPTHALFWVADAIGKNPEARLIYSDEDKIDEAGMRFDPYFKCDWNLDLFYSHNMISHLGVYRADIVKKIQGFRLGLEGSQDHDLALRFIEHIQQNQIHHIPRVLYHWRVHPESTAHSGEAKPYATLAGERALNDHFERKQIMATAEHDQCGYRVSYALPPEVPLVSLIIPTKNGKKLLKQCIDSILEKTTYQNYEILIIDNGSDERESLQYFESLKINPRIRVLRDDGPFNYSALNNRAVEQAKGEIIGLINNDIEVISPEWLSEMVSIALQPEVGAVGARLWYPDNTLQHGGVIIGLGGVAGHAHSQLCKNNPGYFGRARVSQTLSAVTAACLVVKKSIYEKIGGLDVNNLTVAFNDVDFCLRAADHGYRNIWTPYAELYHHESATRGSDNTPEKRDRFEKEISYMINRWNLKNFSDKFYSPNLSLTHPSFELAWPPRIKI
jgi:glycosyltransferase involved in cell wall biosynthesis